MIDVIKEYMVSLGAEVDEKGFREFKKTLDEADKGVNSFAANFGKNFVKAAGFWVTAIAGATAATDSLLKKTAEADLKYEKLARSMWTTKENAKSMQTVLDAMGQSKEDVMWIPELNAQYRELVSLGNQMKAPQELSEQMKMIRSIGFEFTRLKLEITHATEWISYYLVKYLGEPLSKMKKSLSEFNDKIVKEMPRWTKAIAQGLSFFVKAGMAVIRVVTALWNRLEKFWDSLPKGVKKAITAISALAMVVMSGPLGWMIAAIGLALLLLEDFFGYLDGKESSQTLAPIWEKLVKVLKTIDGWITNVNEVINQLYETFEDSSSLEEYVDLIKDLLYVVYDLGEYITGGLVWGIKDLYKYLDENGSIARFYDSIVDLWDGFMELGKGIANVFRETKKWFEYVTRQTSFMQFWEGLKRALMGVRDIASTVVSTIGGIGKVIGLLLQGKWAQAGKAALELGSNHIKGMFGGAKDLAGGGWNMFSGGVGMTGDLVSYVAGGGKGKTWDHGYPSVRTDDLKPGVLAAMDDLGQWLNMMSGGKNSKLFVTAGTNGDHSGGTYSHANGFKADFGGAGPGKYDWLDDPKNRALMIAYAKSRGYELRDEYLPQNDPNWSGPHMDLAATTYQPPASSFGTSNSSSNSVSVGQINVYPSPGMNEQDLANKTAIGIGGLRGSGTFKDAITSLGVVGVSQ